MRFLVSVAGNTRTIPMNAFAPEALRAQGHEVVVFSHQYKNLGERLLKRISPERLRRLFNRQVLRLADRHRPDVFLAIYGKPHDAETLRALKAKGIRTACWWLNDPFELGIGQPAVAEFDHYFSNSAGARPDYERAGVRRFHFLPVGIAPATHRHLPGLEKRYDLLFAGDHKRNREEMLERLVRLGFQVAIMGPWKRKLAADSILRPHLVHGGFFTPQAMVEAFNQSRIVLNLHTWHGLFDYGVNPRLFEAAGCRAFQLTDRKAEMGELFDLPDELVTFGTLDELPDLIRHYLAHEREREGVAERAWRRAQVSHTYAERMRRLVELLGAS